MVPSGVKWLAPFFSCSTCHQITPLVLVTREKNVVYAYKNRFLEFFSMAQFFFKRIVRLGQTRYELKLPAQLI